jgi:hypothetical protein
MLAEVDVPNEDGSLFPGMYAVVTFVEIRGAQPLTIPGDSVVVRNDRTAVAVVQDNQVKLVPVQIGRDYGPSVEVLSGVREGDWVVATVTDAVRQGIKVRTRAQQQDGQSGGQGNDQSEQAPDEEPNQYGDQSIVNSAAESSTQKGKPGNGSGQNSAGKQQKQAGNSKKAGAQ